MRALSFAAITAIVVVVATAPSATTKTTTKTQCERLAGVQRLVFSASRFPNVRRQSGAPSCGAAGRLG